MEMLEQRDVDEKSWGIYEKEEEEEEIQNLETMPKSRDINQPLH